MSLSKDTAVLSTSRVRTCVCKPAAVQAAAEELHARSKGHLTQVPKRGNTEERERREREKRTGAREKERQTEMERFTAQRDGACV